MQNSGQGHSQSGDVGQGVEVGCAAAIAHPEALLARRFETGVVAFAFCAQSVEPLEAETIPVNRESVV